jgi:hypothetical protein
MPNESQTGKATVFGLESTTLSGFATLLNQSGKASHKFKLGETLDGNGSDANLTATNAMIELDWEFVPVGASKAAAAAVTVFLAPLAKVTIAGHPVTVYNGDWIYIGDAGMSMTNVERLSYSLKLRKYVDPTQNASLTTAVA